MLTNYESSSYQDDQRCYHQYNDSWKKLRNNTNNHCSMLASLASRPDLPVLRVKVWLARLVEHVYVVGCTDVCFCVR